MSLNSTIPISNNFDDKSTEGTDKLTEDLSLAIQASMAFIGFIGNSLTFITLKKNGDIFATSVLKLIKNQAILDAIVCFLGSIYVLQPPMWKTHWNEYLDIFICHVSMYVFLLMLGCVCVCVCVYEREIERKRERARETERDRERQTDRERDRDRDRERKSHCNR